MIKRLLPKGFWSDSYVPLRLHGFGVILAFFGLTLLGFLAANLFGRTLIRLGETILARMPIVRSIYKSAKQIFETVFSSSGTTFRKAGMIEFPGEESYFGVSAMRIQSDGGLLFLSSRTRGH